MRRAIAASLVVALCAAFGAVRGQTNGGTKEGRAKPRPDLSGTWLLDPSLDVKLQDRTGGSKLVRVSIQHAEPEIRIVRVGEREGAETARESVYYTDGRGETNQAPAFTTRPEGEPRLEEMKSKTKWDGNKLVTRSSTRVAVGVTHINVTLIDEWRLAPDGQTLTQRTTVRFEPVGGIERPGEPGHVVVRSAPHETKRIFRRAAT